MIRQEQKHEIMNKKTFGIFIFVNAVILLLLILEERYIGSPGRFSLDSYNPFSWEQIWDNIGGYVIFSTIFTLFFFWLYFMSKRNKQSS